MATGTGKTMVMACFILYHFLNRRVYKTDTRFADYFLILVPSITIRDRLSVLYVDVQTNIISQKKDYYHQRDLVPKQFLQKLNNLNSRLAITNYHSLERSSLQGNKQSPLDEKWTRMGKRQEAKESFS